MPTALQEGVKHFTVILIHAATYCTYVIYIISGNINWRYPWRRVWFCGQHGDSRALWFRLMTFQATIVVMVIIPFAILCRHGVGIPFINFTQRMRILLSLVEFDEKVVKVRLVKVLFWTKWVVGSSDSIRKRLLVSCDRALLYSWSFVFFPFGFLVLNWISIFIELHQFFLAVLLLFLLLSVLASTKVVWDGPSISTE